ncbi:DUF2147 domain-containing protein [Arsenicibacter rosenii]|uniref:SIGNAL peptide protein n=1 Tax=Arsenicibacter rosenii TaxID=1750698 RepID=A0A1S2VFI7_9BACT|nr:DUF2147 domain-containing protein [Arsenicibacter rosenii]OIN57483.1 SIGNAL peptide protein [Arsenicibacter rosenii]
MLKQTFWVVVLVFFVGIFSAHAQSNPDAIVGTWLNGTKKGHIQLYKQGDKYFGKIVWLKEPNDPATGKPKTDVKNENAANHNRPVLGLVNLTNFEYDGGNVWDEGKIYNPEDGKTYSCKLTLKDANTLDVRGFVGISLIGKTQTWTRVK